MDELKRFKTEINLAAYAEAHGYEIDRRESSRSSLVMRRGGDKIIVATGKDGHGIYFSVRDVADRGSIVDFVQRRHPGMNLGQVRKDLRLWLDGPASFPYRPHQLEIQKPEPSTRDRRQVMSAWMSMTPAPCHPFLIGERGISVDILADLRFIDVVKIDSFGNAVFPHYDHDGVCGFELKNKGFTGFSKGGTKGIWRSENIRAASLVVVAESAIDCLSYAQLFPSRDASYVSVGGAMSGQQRELLRAQFSLGKLTKIIIATDNDNSGEKLAEELTGLVPLGLVCRRVRPSCKDWNDQLKGVDKAA